MNRRSFLQAVAAFVAAPSVLALLPKSSAVAFDSFKQYGNYVVYTDIGTEAEMIEYVWLAVVTNARQFLPAGTKFELIHRPPLPTTDDPLGQIGSLAWKYSPGPRDPKAIWMTA